MANRALVHPDRVRALFNQMRADLQAMAERHAAAVARLQAKVVALQAEVDGVRAAFDELRSISLARQRAEAEVAELHRLREIGRARAAERDPATPLQ